MSPARAPFRLGGVTVAPGRRGLVELPNARLITGGQAALPVRVVHGRNDGATIWLSAAIHGDEIVGVEIIRRVLARVDPRTVSGTVLAVPVVNVHGFLANNRYLPDRRDLNRSFPGSPRGSLASRVAHLFLTQVVARADVGIDLHTGSDNRTNLPQIRAFIDDPRTRELALAFGAPIVIHARGRDGSLREAARAAGKTVLVYEGGEASRFDARAIEVGTMGVLRVMQHLEMIRGDFLPAVEPPLEAERTSWVRAGRSGILLTETEVGDWVSKGDRIGRVVDAVGQHRSIVSASRSGLVIGKRLQPLVNQGDAVFNIAVTTPQPVLGADDEPTEAETGAEDAQENDDH